MYANNFAYRKAVMHDKIESFKTNISDSVVRAIQWAEENPEAATAIATSLGTLCFHAYRRHVKYVDRKHDEYIRNSTIYDRSIGMYWETRKPLTSNQKLIIAERHRAGESYGHILADLNLLKR